MCCSGASVDVDAFICLPAAYVLVAAAMVVQMGFVLAPSSAVVDGTFAAASYTSKPVEMRVFHTHVHNLVCTWARTQVAKRLGCFDEDRNRSDCFGQDTPRRQKGQSPNRLNSGEPLFAGTFACLPIQSLTTDVGATIQMHPSQWKYPM